MQWSALWTDFSIYLMDVAIWFPWTFNILKALNFYFFYLLKIMNKISLLFSLFANIAFVLDFTCFLFLIITSVSISFPCFLFSVSFFNVCLYIQWFDLFAICSGLISRFSFSQYFTACFSVLLKYFTILKDWNQYFISTVENK